VGKKWGQILTEQGFCKWLKMKIEQKYARLKCFGQSVLTIQYHKRIASTVLTNYKQ